MSILKSIRNRCFHHLSNMDVSTRGWIGIDIGTRALKFAQVDRRDDQFFIANRWSVNHDDMPFDAAQLSRGWLANSALSRSGFRNLFSGVQCAAAISLSFQTLRSFELPRADPEEIREMVREEIAADSSHSDEDFVFDYWIGHDGSDETIDVAALSMPSGMATRVAKDLFHNGYECQSLDGLPLALARAVDMAQYGNSGPVAALDLGISEFTFVIVDKGKPVYTRILRGGGLENVIETLRESFGLSYALAMQLLTRSVVDQERRSFRDIVGSTQCLMLPWAVFLEELERTFEYVNEQLREWTPTKLVLFGGGTSIHGIAEHLSCQIGLPTETWSLATSDPQSITDDALYGVAAALSALRWEQLA